MKRIKRFLFWGMVMAMAVNTAWAAELSGAEPLKTGETMNFVIKYLGAPIGDAEATILGEETIQGRRAYHIRAFVRSSPVIDLIYKVRGEHHTYIDAEKMRSLRYEVRKIGAERADYIMDFDQKKHTVRYTYPASGKTKTLSTEPDSQDQLSLAFAFRQHALTENSSVSMPLHADQKKWQVPVKVLKTSEQKNKVLGNVRAIEAEPYLGFVNALVKKGKVRGWMTADERRIPLAIEVRVPVLGAVKAELSSYSVEGAAA